jgi:hypothetical protein
MKEKDVSLVLEAYNGSIVTALLDLFSDIGLERSKFTFNTSMLAQVLLLQFLILVLITN